MKRVKQNDGRYILVDQEGGQYIWVGRELRKLGDNDFLDRSEHSLEADEYQREYNRKHGR